MRQGRIFAVGMTIRAALVSLCALAFAACGGGGISPNQGVELFTPAPLSWQACEEDGYECATLYVPLNYANPTGDTIPIALMRKVATDPAQRMGSVVFNPGGPGTGAANRMMIDMFLRGLNATVAQRLDFVGFDPRGTVATRPACGTDFAYYVAGDLVNPAASAALDSTAKSYAQECAGDAMAQFMGTENVARDMEILRRAMGEGNLTYFGTSYGSEIGIAYADKFPQNLRAMVIDGIYNPGMSPEEILLRRSAAVEGGIQRFFDWCSATADCPINADPQGSYERLLEIARTSPAWVDFEGGGFPLSTGWLTVMNLSFVNNSYYYPTLASQIASALAGDWSGYTTAIAAAAEIGISSGVWVPCQDQPPSSSAAFDEIVDDVAAVAPHIGGFLANIQRPCEFRYFPANDPVPVNYSYGSRGPVPIMVWGTTGDPATAYQNAVDATAQLENAALFTLVAYQHTAIGTTPCVIEKQSSYLIDAAIPGGDRTCTLE